MMSLKRRNQDRFHVLEKYFSALWCVLTTVVNIIRFNPIISNGDKSRYRLVNPSVDFHVSDISIAQK